MHGRTNGYYATLFNVCSFPRSQSNISQHLAILRDKGILAFRKDANRVYYRVGDARTLRLIGLMREVFCARQPSHSSPT